MTESYEIPHLNASNQPVYLLRAPLPFLTCGRQPPLSPCQVSPCEVLTRSPARVEEGLVSCSDSRLNKSAEINARERQRTRVLENRYYSNWHIGMYTCARRIIVAIRRFNADSMLSRIIHLRPQEPRPWLPPALVDFFQLIVALD